MKINQRGLDNLKGVDSRLVALAHAVADVIDTEYKGLGFTVTEGVRTLARQKEMVATGKSQTLKSYHINGKAIDVYAYQDGVGSYDWKYYERINTVMQRVAKEKGLKITWGGSWITIKDGVHFQLEN